MKSDPIKLDLELRDGKTVTYSSYSEDFSSLRLYKSWLVPGPDSAIKGDKLNWPEKETTNLG